VNEGLLVESEARTNLVTTSNNFSGSGYWNGGTANGTITNSVAVGPDGETSAASYVAPNATGSATLFSKTSLDLSASIHTLSVFVKAGAAQWIRIGITSTAEISSYFDIQNGTVGTQLNATGLIENFGDGWYRITLSNFTGDGTDSPFVALSDTGSSATYTGDGSTVDCYVFGAQLEAGSTPSSYIPTSGATVTRAAETLTVAAADLPYPTPRVIGGELVTNGTFDTDTTGWTPFNFQGHSVTLSSVSGQLNIANDPVNGGNAVAYQSISTVAGRVYLLNFDWVFGSGLFRVRDATLSGTNLGDVTVSAPGSLTRIFKAASSTTVISATQNTTVAGTVRILDNVSVREIDPLSVSIQMQGRMTYADENEVFEVNPWWWVKDVNNRIIPYVSTLSADTGQVWFLQEAANVADAVASAFDTYSPGINVPYNISSRHGSTFINGAIDGTALTAANTPVALPDLSATNLSLAFNYMGCLKLFRMWDQDLGDTGIAAASITKPAIFGLPTISGDVVDLQVGEALVAVSAPVVIGTPTPTTTWQWLRDGAPISGATSSSYVLTGDDVGSQISVRQTETNAGGSASATSAETATVQVLLSTIVTWDSSADTYTQDIFAEDASAVTWDAVADTYTQSIFAGA
jgi:hypothetical protein